jgi:hypothetical protein
MTGDPSMMDESTTSAELWAVLTTGMGDLHPCASRRLAVRNATWLNLSLVSSLDRDDEHRLLVYNVPVVWDADPEGHASALAEEESADPRWSDPDVDVIQNLARHILKSKTAGEEGRR